MVVNGQKNFFMAEGSKTRRTRNREKKNETRKEKTPSNHACLLACLQPKCIPHIMTPNLRQHLKTPINEKPGSVRPSHQREGW